MSENQGWAFNDNGEQVAVYWPTALDDLEDVNPTEPSVRELEGKIVKGLIETLMANPTPKAVFREMYALVFSHWPERLLNMQQKDVAEYLGVSPQAFNQFLARRMEDRGMEVGVIHDLLCRVTATPEEVQEEAVQEEFNLGA